MYLILFGLFAVLWSIGTAIAAIYCAVHAWWLPAIFFAVIMDWFKVNLTGGTK